MRNTYLIQGMFCQVFYFYNDALNLSFEFKVLTSPKKMLTEFRELTDYLTYGTESSTVGKVVNRNPRFLLVT